MSALWFVGGVVCGILLSLLWGSMALARQQKQRLDAVDAFLNGIVEGLKTPRVEQSKATWESRGSDRLN